MIEMKRKERGTATRDQVRNYLLVTALLLVAITFVSLFVDLSGIERNYRSLAAVVGRTIFRTVSASMDWNTRRGVIAAPPARPPRQGAPRAGRPREGAGAKPAPIDHAAMAREVAGLIARERGISIRLTSRNPAKPESRPDPWEAESLDQFARGAREAHTLIQSDNGAVFRFMSPLLSEAECQRCHASSPAAQDNVLGGISISFSYLPFQRATDRHKSDTYLLHALFLFISLTAVTLLGVKLLDNVGALQDTLLHVRRLEGLLPICARCKKIRTEGANPFDMASWVAVEKYIRERTDADFTHGLCPECARELYPELGPDR